VRLLALAGILLALGPSAGSASPSPHALLASILAAMKRERSVHYVASSTFGSVTIAQVGDVGATTGIQRITYRNGATGRVTVVVAANTAFFRGDAIALANYMGFKARPAVKYANVWVKIPHDNPDYSAVAADVTIPSNAESLPPSGKLTLLPDTTIAGQRVVGVQGVASTGQGRVVQKLYARATGAPLPVREVASRGADARFTVTFSRWNEPLTFFVPPNAVPISKTGLQ
jgi:hypothetical protein